MNWTKAIRYGLLLLGLTVAIAAMALSSPPPPPYGLAGSCNSCCPGEADCDAPDLGCNMNYKCNGTGCQGSYVCTSRGQ